MNINEYMNIEKFNYEQYCDYLQEKYGIGRSDYFTKSWNKNHKCTRTAEGLVAHHKFEDHAALLSTPKEAMNFPFDWQKSENIVYCDYLEHLLLHILICESEHKNALKNEIVGIGGILQFIVPELNDVYSGWQTNQIWRANCHNKIIDDKDVYLVLIKRLKDNCHSYPLYNDLLLLSSYNNLFGLWNRENNSKIFNEISSL